MELMEISQHVLGLETRGAALLREKAWERVQGFGNVRKDNLPGMNKLKAKERKAARARWQRIPCVNTYQPLLQAIIEMTGVVPSKIEHYDTPPSFISGRGYGDGYSIYGGGPLVTMPDGTLLLGQIDRGEICFGLAVRCKKCGVVYPDYHFGHNSCEVEGLSDFARFGRKLVPLEHTVDGQKHGKWDLNLGDIRAVA